MVTYLTHGDCVGKRGGEGRVGSCTQGVGGMSVEQNAQERGGSVGVQNTLFRGLVFTSWLIGAFDWYS